MKDVSWKDRRIIVTYRCVKCGRLESFADRHPY